MEKNYNGSLDFVSYAPPEISRSIRSQLRQLQFPFNEHDPEQWRENPACCNQNVLLLVLGGNTPKKLFRSLPPDQSMMVVFCALKSEWDTRIMAHCDDFCGWPCGQNELLFRLNRLLEKKEDENADGAEVDEGDDWIKRNLIGLSPEILKIKAQIRKIARYHTPVLIEGETGTGKEVIARAIHYLGPRAGFPFIPVNCGALPDSLMENELFGHEKGAYTDARNSQPGLIARAEGGTLFLDEIEALTSKGQISLLRFVEDRQYTPLGGKRAKKANVNIIAASNKPLSKLVEQSEFREDLLFRMNVITLNLPPLCKRASDIEPLAEHFMQRYRNIYRQNDKRLHPNTLEWMKKYPWPGNIRQLENFIHRAFLLDEGVYIHRDGPENSPLPNEPVLPVLQHYIDYEMPFCQAKKNVIDQFERTYLTELLAKTNGNVTSAAKLAGKERRAFGKLLLKHGIDKNRYRMAKKHQRAK
ncbi:MAG: sigma 54-interacting transcriptional regulator [Gammaproteobacteria bacterium]